MFNNERIRKFLSNAIGYFCILIFYSLTTYIVFIFYFKIGATALKYGEYKKIFFHFFFGNWLVINIYFNYTMAWLTSPGLAKHYQYLARQYPTCRRCLLFKPPRTHHCSWCDLCILRYDHHCPWLNNCIGFYNHRYFYQFCCFMTIGCFYAGIYGYREYQISLLHIQLFHHIDSFFMAPDIFETMGSNGFITYYIFMLAFIMGFPLLGLSCWHGRMIGRGETSVERILNENYIDRYYQEGVILVKTHDIGLIGNWKRFLAIRNRKEFFQRILLPSIHKPKGNGVLTDDFDIYMKSPKPKKSTERSFTYDLYPTDGSHHLLRDDLLHKHQFDLPSWQRQSISNTFTSCYKSYTPVQQRKNNLFVKRT